MSLRFRNKALRALPSLLSDTATLGFTLLEVLISIVLLIVISLAISQATGETYKLREVLSNESDFYNTIRLSMGIMDRDVSLIYTPSLILPEKKASTTPGTPDPTATAEQNELDQLAAGDLGRSTNFLGVVIHKTGIRPFRFVGTESKMSFVSTSHMRVYKDAPESEFSKVSYELQQDRTADRDHPSQVLMKMESPNAFDDDDSKDKYKHTYPLLHGVTKLKYEYYRKEKLRWESSWDSDGNDVKGLYPDAVRVTLEVHGPTKLLFEGTYEFRPEIPLRGLDPST